MELQNLRCLRKRYLLGVRITDQTSKLLYPFDHIAGGNLTLPDGGKEGIDIRELLLPHNLQQGLGVQKALNRKPLTP